MLLAIFIYNYGARRQSTDASGELINAMQHFYLPFKSDPISLPLLAYIVITVLDMVGSSNAVNLTDGMDGLAGGCMIIVDVRLPDAGLGGGRAGVGELPAPAVRAEAAE